MSIKSLLFLWYARFIVKREYYIHLNAYQIQKKLLNSLISQNQNSDFGKAYFFKKIIHQNDFIQRVPLRVYEDYIPYIERIKQGEHNVLIQGNPLYFLITSGTTAGSKYIPISRMGLKHQINAALKQLCFYATNTGNAKFLNHKMIFIQGSPELDNSLPIPSGRLSGVVYHHIPKFFQTNKLPKYATNIIENWQKKINAIVDETFYQDISVIGGIPPWCIQYFEKLLVKTKKNNLKSIFPNLEIYIHGGVDFSSYKLNIEKLLGNKITCLQTFPASEGFFALQDRLDADDMLLLLNQGVYYEFIPFDDIHNAFPSTINIEQVEIYTSYELVITNNSGLWRYRMGDLVQFTSVHPYRIKVVGRTAQYISAFGEHIIGYEVEKTMEEAIEKFGLEMEDFHVSPNVDEKRYEWRIEWKNIPCTNMRYLENFFDQSLLEKNKYYHHLIQGNIIHTCRIIPIPEGSFQKMRLKLGKEGGQNKVIRISNDNQYALMLDKLKS